MTGDSFLDLCVVSSPYAYYDTPRGGVVVLSGNGDGTFRTSPDQYLVGVEPRGLAVGDFNYDERD